MYSFFEGFFSVDKILKTIFKVLPDEYGAVRTAVVNMKGREYKRSIHELCLIQRSNVSV